MKVAVISGINLYSGGPLRIYYAFLDTVKQLPFFNEWKFIIYVHRKELFEQYNQDFEVIELPKSRKNYIYRLYYEYIFFGLYSKKNEIDVWISLHDFTPNVNAKHRYVYCHNPIIFHPELSVFTFSHMTGYLFAKIYGFLYGINIRKNDGVIFQQDWIRREFEEKYGINNGIVAYPVVEQHPVNITENYVKDTRNWESKEKYIFFYPAFARGFKNFELICKAVKLLKGKYDFEVWLTIDGSENKYAKEIVDKYKHIHEIKFIGNQNFEEMTERYMCADSLIFPSKLETWGLPISEFKAYGKPMLVVNLPYAHETVGNYDKVSFFEPNAYKDLATLMEESINGSIQYNGNRLSDIKSPFYSDWGELVERILGET